MTFVVKTDCSVISGENTYYLGLIELSTGNLLFLSDQPQFGFGTIAMAAPAQPPFKNTTGSPILFGLKDTMLATILSKTASQKFGKPVMSMIFLKSEVVPTAEKLQDFIRKINDKLDQIISKTEIQEKSE